MAEDICRAMSGPSRAVLPAPVAGCVLVYIDEFDRVAARILVEHLNDPGDCGSFRHVRKDAQPDRRHGGGWYGNLAPLLKSRGRFRLYGILGPLPHVSKVGGAP